MPRLSISIVALAGFVPSAPADVCVVRRASLDAAGGQADGHSRNGPGAEQANGPSYHASISADGRYVVFESDATNLAIDINGVRDVFLYDRLQVTTQRVSVASNGSHLFFQGTTEAGGGIGLPFGDGLRCVSGTVIRLGTRLASGDAASFGHGLGSEPAISIKGAVPPSGASLRCQGWYRDTPPFCMPEGFNFTNGLRIDWAP